MSRIHVKLQDDIKILVSVESLQRRLPASSPLLVLLQQEVEQASHPVTELEILNELPPHLVGCTMSMKALQILVEHLGTDEDDPLMFKSLENMLSVTLAVHIYVIADWMLAGPIAKGISAWFCQMWLRHSECVLAGLCGVESWIIQLAARSHLFNSASISLTALSEIVNTKIAQTQADVQSMQRCIDQRMAELAALKSLTSALEAEGAQPNRPAVESSFPVFVSFQGQTTIVPGCTTATNAQDIKGCMAARIGVPEQLQRFEFGGKPLPDTEALVSIGVRRDSTLNLAVRKDARPKPFPHTVHVRLGGDEVVSCAANEDDTVRAILLKLNLEGILVYGGSVLRDDLPLADLQLPDVPLFYFVSRRVRRRLGDGR